MPEVVDWRSCQPSDVVRRAAEILRAGGLVAFPTDTCYEVAASCEMPEAVASLPRTEKRLLTLAATGTEQLLDWVPGLSRIGRRLARSCWPGPLTIIADAQAEAGRRVSDAVREQLGEQGTVAFRAPAHYAIQQTLLLLPEGHPVALAEAGTALEPAVLEDWGERVTLIIDDGPTLFGREATVVRVNGERWEMVREGAISAAQVEELTPCRILFVCTGNTCRSPLAEVLCAKLLAERLGCGVAELPQRGFVVQSAGLAAMMGGEAAGEAVAIAQELGADLSGHKSQPLTRELLLQADYLFVMTRSHLQMLSALQAHGGPAPRLLCTRGDDIPDPIGSPAEVYRECAKAIVENLQELIPELQA